MGTGQGPQKVVREVQRRTRRRFSAEEKIRIVLEGLRGEQSIAELCRREGLAPNLYYRWSKEFGAHAGSAIPSADAREDRAIPPVDEERGEARQLLQPVGARARDRTLRRALQPPALPRVATERDACRCFPWSSAGDLDATGENQEENNGSPQAGESTRRLGGGTRRECLLEIVPISPDSADDVHSPKRSIALLKNLNYV